MADMDEPGCSVGQLEKSLDDIIVSTCGKPENMETSTMTDQSQQPTPMLDDKITVLDNKILLFLKSQKIQRELHHNTL